MSRLLSTIALDVRLQTRNRLYVIGIGVAVSIGFAARYFLQVAAVAALLPGLWLGAVGGTTFLFVAGMVLFEKGERTLDAIIVSPLPLDAYLTSKVVTLAGFAIVESLIVLALAHGFGDVNLLPVLLGLASLGVVYTLAAIGQVVSETTVTDFLVPSGIVWMTLLQVPFLHAFGIWTHPVLYLFPTQPTVVLMIGGFAELAPWQWAYGIGYGLASIVLLGWWAARRFRVHIVERGIES